MKVCLDTNVLISGIFWKGLPGKILDLWIADEFDLLASFPMLDEYSRILKRIAAQMDTELADTWRQMLTAKLILIAPLRQRIRRSRDIYDDMFLECMIAGEGDYLVTGDSDLLELDGEMNFPIVNPKTFLRAVS